MSADEGTKSFLLYGSLLVLFFKILYTIPMKNQKPNLELYIHIPFCVRKCAYCDFLSAPATEDVQTEYVEALKQEIRENRQLGEQYQVSTIFFGGGTPSILPGEQLAGILEEIKRYFVLQADAEISVECNPGTLTEEKLTRYRRAGVNRLSLGLQSTDNEELRLLGRIHTWEEFQTSYTLARKAGFTNINVDLMSALPGQTLESWQKSLYQVLDLEPEHVSAYSLIIEEGTPFYERYAEAAGQKGQEGQQAELAKLPDEDTERQMYYDTGGILQKAGYDRYEISNYAKPGRECRHNLGYWRRVDYKGFGIGAASLLNGWRLQNRTELQPYLRRQFGYQSREQLTEADTLAETMFLGLRTMKGVELTEQMRRVYAKVLEKYVGQGFLEEREGWLRLTERGIDVSNRILAEFLPEETQE